MKYSPTYLAIGSSSGSESAGVSVVKLDNNSGEMTLCSVAKCAYPTFLAESPCRSFIYVVSETSEFDGRYGGSVTSFRWDRDSRRLALLNQKPVGGASPCHVSVDPSGRRLAVSNYGDGSHTVVPILADGSLGTATCLVRNKGTLGPSQTSAHAHAMVFESDRLAFACDLGLDKVLGYEMTRDGWLVEIDGAGAQMAGGAGPRHIVLHSRLPVAYVINELDSTICALRREPRGRLSIIQTVSTLPPEYSAGNWCADIHLGAGEKFLYGSNRGHDSLAIFSVDTASGGLAALGHVDTGGSFPRHFAFVATDLILVVNQKSDAIVAFHVGDDGIPRPTGVRFATPSPTCIVPLG